MAEQGAGKIILLKKRRRPVSFCGKKKLNSPSLFVTLNL